MDLRISIQNLIVISLGYEKRITDSSYLEYEDYDDYISESFYSKLLDEYLDYGIGDYYKITSEQFMDLSPDIMSIYIDRARKRKEREMQEMEEAQRALNDTDNKGSEMQSEPKLHPAQQVRKEALEKQQQNKVEEQIKQVEKK